MPGEAQRLDAGTIVDRRDLKTITGGLVNIPDPERLVHLEFRRFAGCPVCNLHLRSLAARHGEIVAAGVRTVVVFHSPADELRVHTSDLPFDVIADPDKRLYREFGVEAGVRSLLNPRAWGPVLGGVLLDLADVVRRRRSLPERTQEGGRLGLPADFLIGSDGRVLDRKYGEHAYDQWSVEEILALAERALPARATETGE